MTPGTLLSVDDNEDDQLLLQRAWKKSGLLLDLQMVGDGEQAIEYLSGCGNYGDRDRFPLPGLLLLDLKMPRKSGFEVLEWMAGRASVKSLPVAVFTSSQAAADIKSAYDLGARWYLTKPVDYVELRQWVQLLGLWFQNPRENDLSSSIHYRPPHSSRID